jgi:hypothetical protein
MVQAEAMQEDHGLTCPAYFVEELGAIYVSEAGFSFHFYWANVVEALLLRIPATKASAATQIPGARIRRTRPIQLSQ